MIEPTPTYTKWLRLVAWADRYARIQKRRFRVEFRDGQWITEVIQQQKKK